MNNETICKNCGGSYAIHNADTNQCPVNGVEAPIGKSQYWMEQVFAPAPAAPEPEHKNRYSYYGINGEYFVYDNEENCIPLGYGGKPGTKKAIQAICDKLNAPEPSAPIRREEGKSLHETSSYTLVNLDNVRLQEERNELLKTIYHEIDSCCIRATENVSMTDIRAILVKHGANEPDLW